MLIVGMMGLLTKEQAYFAQKSCRNVIESDQGLSHFAESSDDSENADQSQVRPPILQHRTSFAKRKIQRLLRSRNEVDRRLVQVSQMLQ